MFGIVASKKLPLKSYLVFFLRDVFAMSFAFNVPSIAGKWIHENY